MAFTDQVKSVLPNFDLADVGGFAFWGIIFVLALIIIGSIFALWAWWYINKKKFLYTVRIFEKVDGRYQPTKSDRAMERKIGSGGDTVFFFKKMKRIVPTPTIQTGVNTYWFAKREDGELINIGMEDIDLKLREANISYLDKETRYARASLQKINKDRFSKETWWQKYGRDVLTVVFIVVISVMLLLLLSKFVQMIGSVDGVLQSSEIILERSAEILGAIDNIQSPSGVVPA